MRISCLESLESRRMLVGNLNTLIVVDQIGYRADATRKLAMLADPQGGQNAALAYTPGSSFQVRRSSDDGIALSGTLQSWRSGQTHAESGDRAWTADFSSLATPGEYYIYEPATNSRSHAFRVHNAVFADTLVASMRTFFYQRSGIDITPQHGGNWNHPASHVGPGQDLEARLLTGTTPQGSPRNLSGGWYDAGDFNRYIPFTTGVMWDLLNAFRWNPDIFGDDTNIPESNNGIPDALDEIKFQLDWMLKMQQVDGGVLNRVGNRSYDVGAGPQFDTQPRFYTQATTWATASFAATTANASRMFDAILPAYAQTLRTAATNAWTYLSARPTMQPANGSDGATLAAAPAGSESAEDRRLRVLAAAELWAATGNATYKSYFESNYNQSALTHNGHHPILNNRFDPTLATDLNRALITYVQQPGANATIASQIRSALRTHIDWTVGYNNNTDDPYRAYMWAGHYTWGSNQLKANWANMFVYALNIGLDTTRHPEFRAQAQHYLHYIHGRNPLGVNYLTNASGLGAEVSVMQPYHGWFQHGSPLYDGAGSQFGPAPGYLVGGPNQFFSVSWISPPFGQPPLKAWRDWNTAWNPSQQANENSWEITEPAIYYQAAYTLLLAEFTPDVVAPRVNASSIHFETAQRVELGFSESIGGITGATLTNLSTGQTLASSALAVTQSGGQWRIARSAGLLDNGRWRLTIPATGVLDGAGNAMAQPFDFEFDILAGDTNRDGVVSFADLLVLAQNYGQTGRVFSQGNVDYDPQGRVEFNDLLIVAQNYTTESIVQTSPRRSATRSPRMADVLA
jgi:hypothetical protein